MFFKVNFTFCDDKTFTAVVDKPSLPKFIDNLSKGEVYWDRGKGFWLAWSQIRFIQIEEMSQQTEKTPEFHDPIAY